MCVTIALLYKLCLQFVFQVKVTEIVDVTDAESSIILSPDECENNIQLEFDDDEWLSQHVMQTEGQYHSDITKLAIFSTVMVPRCRSQWPHGLRHELSWLAGTLGSWVRIPLKAWMSVCVYSVFVLFCVQVEAL
jgi:hypothetical protein